MLGAELPARARHGAAQGVRGRRWPLGHKRRGAQPLTPRTPWQDGRKARPQKKMIGAEVRPSALVGRMRAEFSWCCLLHKLLLWIYIYPIHQRPAAGSEMGLKPAKRDETPAAGGGSARSAKAWSPQATSPDLGPRLAQFVNSGYPYTDARSEGFSCRPDAGQHRRNLRVDGFYLERRQLFH